MELHSQLNFQDKRMCKAELEDYFGDILNMVDLPFEGMEGDGFAEDWASKLGPIPTEIFSELAPPQTALTNTFGYSMDLPFGYHVLNNRTAERQYHLNHVEGASKKYQNVKISQLKKQSSFDEEDKKLYPIEASFQVPSPNSVLESRTSSSSNKGVSFGIEFYIPVRARSKRLRPIANPWLLSSLIVHPNKDKRRKKPFKNPVIMETKRCLEKLEPLGIKKCAHCEITNTPQWRSGPMGLKTLCNACGVRYRSGRLYTEYRPAASPSFVPAFHSNSHRKVMEIRQKAVE